MGTFFRNGKDKANCKHCSKELNSKGGTTCLRHHLKVHNIGLSNKQDRAHNPTINFSPVDNEDLYEEEIVRMAALDGLPFNQIATAKFIKESWKKDLKGLPAHQPQFNVL